MADPAAAVVEAIYAARTVLVTCHRNPDGDAVGSLLAVGIALERLGKAVTLYSPDPLAYPFRDLPRAADVVTDLDPLTRYDLTIALDTGDVRQLGDHVPEPPRRGVLAVLDHHASGRPFGDVRWHEPGAAATGVLVAELLERLGVPLDQELAEPLWCALYTDTGGFRYSSTDAAVLRLAARLVETGLSPWEMTVKLYENNPLARMRLLALALGTLVVSDSGQVASLAITEAMLQEAQADATMLDGLINYARGIAGVEVAVQVLQAGEACRISLRSKGRVDVGRLAAHLGGRGHHNAGGCVLQGAPAEVRRRVQGLLQAELDALDRGADEGESP